MELQTNRFLPNVPQLENKLVLLLEDSAESILLQKKIIERSGGVVKVATSVDEALSFIENQKPDLLLIDIELSDGMRKGFQFLLQAGVSDHRLRVPVLIVSGKNDEDSRFDARRLGAWEFIPKPFTPQQYEAKIRLAFEMAPPVWGSDVEIEVESDGESA